MKRFTEFWYSTALMPEGVRLSFHKGVGKKFERLEEFEKNYNVAKWAAEDYADRYDDGTVNRLTELQKLEWPAAFTLYESRDGAATAHIIVHAEWKLDFVADFMTAVHYH